MSGAFNSQILAEKLSKLNNSQQSIESLSSWCISHRKKAKQVVETWEKLFNSSPREQRVSFLYLANDILQNSRRKGSEFVNEFWKVLPGGLKSVYENGEDHGKNVVMRLVDIWDERKVFGSRGRGLKDDILGKTSPPPVDNNGKSPNPIKLVRKDAHTIRLKLAVGGMPERIVTAYQTVLDEHFNEDTALNKCKDALQLMGKLEKDVDDACTQGIQQGSPLVNDLQEQDSILKQCINQLGSIEATRLALITQLKEALQEQEAKLELIRRQIQVAETETERANNLRLRLMSATATTNPCLSPNPTPHPTITTSVPMETASTKSESNPPLQTSSSLQLLSPQPVTSFTHSLTSSEEQHKKAAAAAMAAKLAASTSSAQMLTSVLSSLVAEEAASMNGSLSSGNTSSSPPIFPADKRPKLEKPMPVADLSNTFFGHLQQQQIGSIPLVLPQTSVSSVPPPFPPPPPLPPVPPPSVQQYAQSSGGMVGVVPYGFSGNPLPPPPPLPSHVSMGMARPGAPPPPPPPLPPPPMPQQQQQQLSSAGFYQPPGMGFYGQQLQAAPPVPRQ